MVKKLFVNDIREYNVQRKIMEDTIRIIQVIGTMITVVTIIHTNRCNHNVSRNNEQNRVGTKVERGEKVLCEKRETIDWKI